MKTMFIIIQFKTNQLLSISIYYLFLMFQAWVDNPTKNFDGKLAMKSYRGFRSMTKKRKQARGYFKISKKIKIKKKISRKK